MALCTFSKARSGVLLIIIIAMVVNGCGISRHDTFYGKTSPPRGQVLRYVSGGEPGSLDPQAGIPLGAIVRIQLALFEGLCEYDPKNMEPIPAIAERWEVNRDSSEYIFHLRRNARWSNGEQITARDFLYSFRRGLSPKLAAPMASLGYYIKYAEAYNARRVFVRDPGNNTYLLTKDFPGEAAEAQSEETSFGADTEFHRYIKSPERLTLSGNATKRAKAVQDNPKLQAALAGKVFDPVRAEDIGVEAVDDFTFRITLSQTVSFFLKMMTHPFFRVVPQKVTEQYQEAWTQPEHIVTSGAFKLKTWTPYHELIVVRDPNYWDAARVQLDEIRFYPMEHEWAIMSEYKVGEVDAVFNHAVPTAWLEMIRPLKDYMDAPEAEISYYQFNITKPPMNDVRVRKAFNMAVNKVSLARWRNAGKPLTAFMPEAIFPGYPQSTGDSFDPLKARELLAQAGYKDAAGNYDPEKFPVDTVELLYDDSPTYKAISEYLQAQWKQNLGVTLPIRSMELKTLITRSYDLDYTGIARGSWVADYMDPYTFLSLFATPGNPTGWYDPKFAALLDEANRMLDTQRRYELLAQAEALLLEAQPVIPLMTETTNWMKKPYVKGMYPNPTTLHPWKFVCIEHDPAKWDYGVPNLSYEKKDADFKEREKELPVCSK